MPDPRNCLNSFSTTGTNLGGKSPSFRTRDVRRDYDNIKQRIENVKDRIEGGVNAAKEGDFLAGQFTSALNELRCPPTPYASYFSQLQPPKYPFMFLAKVVLYEQFNTIFGGDHFPDGGPSWFLKKSGRPNINYEYEEVNMYNFRSQILKRSTFQPVTITMYDDMKDATGSFWNTYVRLMSPITNMAETSLRGYENFGMYWHEGLEVQSPANRLNSTLDKDLRSGAEGPLATPRAAYTASTGVLPTREDVPKEQKLNIIGAIVMAHIIDFGKNTVYYIYRNPKITEINFTELDWETSGPSTIDVTFTYDAFEISYKQPFSEQTVEHMNLPEAYPIKPDGPVVNAGPFSF